MKYNVEAIGYSLDMLLTPPGFVLPYDMCQETAGAGSENNCDVEEILDLTE